MAAEDHFNKGIKLDAEGMCEVSLPWIQNHPPRWTGRNVAESILKNCVESLKETRTLEEYKSVLNGWILEGVIVEVKDSCNDESIICRTELQLKKIQLPVFDVSASQKNLHSVNDCLEKGANTVELIRAILNKFRLKKKGVMTDIQKAFLQFGLNERDRPFPKFVW